MATPTVNTESASSSNAKTEKIGLLNLNLANAKADIKVISAIKKVARERSPKWDRVAGNVQYVARIERVFNRVLAGEKIEEVSVEYRDYIPSSLSQAGPWMPEEVMVALKTIIEDDIYTVKVDKGNYEEKIEWMMRNGMVEPDKDQVRTGKIVKCHKCLRPHVTPEPLLMHLCPACKKEMGKGSGGAKGPGTMVALKSDLERFARAYFSQTNPATKTAIMMKVEELRKKMDLPALTESRIKSAKTAQDLV